MLSAFVKKLLFADELSISDGHVDVLGKHFSLLPMSVVDELFEIDNKKAAKIVSRQVAQVTKSFLQRVGSDELEMVTELFDIFGLGKLQIIAMEKEKADVAVLNSTTAKKDSKWFDCRVTCAVLTGMFSVLFGHDVNCEEKKCISLGAENCEFVIH